MKSLFVIAALIAAPSIASLKGQEPAAKRAEGLATTSDAQPNPAPSMDKCGSGCGGQQGRARKGQGKGQGKSQGKNRQGERAGNCSGLGQALLLTGTSPSALIPPADRPPSLQNYLSELQSTLEKELYARDYYEAADQALSGPPRFGNLAGAEQGHADAIVNLIVYMGGVPVLSHNIPIVTPSTVAEADDTCKDIELLVIRVYKTLIMSCPDPALLPTLLSIQASNYQHLSVVGG